jgi:hypothetical protein
MNVYVETKVPMSFAPKMMVPTVGDHFAEAIGSWVVTDSNGQARVPDIATSRINCTKSTVQCVDAKSHAYDGYMSVDLTDYDIKKWDANSIVFKIYYPCAQEVSQSTELSILFVALVMLLANINNTAKSVVLRMTSGILSYRMAFRYTGKQGKRRGRC